MHINMKKKSLFKRVSGVLTGVFFSTSLILAANENGQLFGSETLIVVVALLLLFVPLFLYVRKLHSNMNDRSDRIIKENAALESLNKEISSRKIPPQNCRQRDVKYKMVYPICKITIQDTCHPKRHSQQHKTEYRYGGI